MECDGLDKLQHLREGQLLRDRADLIAALQEIADDCNELARKAVLDVGERRVWKAIRDKANATLARLEKGVGT